LKRGNNLSLNPSPVREGLKEKIEFSNPSPVREGFEEKVEFSLLSDR
jgi:hypothetical protein